MKKFLKNQNAQSLIETAIMMFFVFTLISVFFVNIGVIQNIRLRLAIVNRYMTYTATHSVNPDKGRNLQQKVLLMLKNGYPVIKKDKKNFKNVSIQLEKQTMKITEKSLPFVPKIVVGHIDVEYILNSSVMQKIVGKNTILLSSGKIYMYQDSLYKSLIPIGKLKKFLKFKEKKKK